MDKQANSKRTDKYKNKVEGVTTGTLIVEGEKLHVVKELLAVASPVLAEKFKDRGLKEVELPGKRFRDIVWMLDELYPETPSPLTEESAGCLLKLAVEYQLNKLKQKCVDVLMKQEKPTLELVTLASVYNAPELLEKSVEDCVKQVHSSELERQCLRPENSGLDAKHLAQILRMKLNVKEGKYGAREGADGRCSW